ncbi:tyrosine-type recombinase/integrase [Alloacidobacterium dinghuense]|uniref:Tyrosine-type recombinase/integrase n=1 Tax=Alloacidobacterium dinghuense TaxID=2763107 RepID=A0A7G8BE83_9BACT|nr:tyrosine-type recombinase/integrase [Alloacidobacterium dinghuense]QNI30853.1 tyrosine-type recombinase/integrase [Alloacidobacterium dinghuense]
MEFEAFLSHWQATKNVSPQTIRAYRSDLQFFEAFLQQEGTRGIEQVDHGVINKYIEYMKQMPNPRFGRTGLSDASISRRLASLSSYLEFTRATSNHQLHNPMLDFTRRWSKNDDPKPIEEVDLDRLLSGVTSLRDRFLLTLFVATGLRVSEMYQLNRDSITIEEEVGDIGDVRVLGTGEVIGKGNKKRRFFVDYETLRLYAEYMATRADETPALFLSERKQRMSVRAMEYTLAAWCRKLSLSHANVHRLRHSYATRLANANISSLILKDLMGHTSLSTTQRYFKLHDTTLARGYFSAMEFLRTGS